jgi:diguanylate cyclase (GGDEF)-like protein
MPENRGQQSFGDVAPVRRHADLNEVLASAARLACEILKSDAAMIALLDEKGYLTFRRQHGLSPQFGERWHCHPTESITGTAFRTGQPHVISDLFAERKYAGEPLAWERLRTLLVLPLKMGEDVTGCLCIGDRRPRHFSPLDVQLAGLFADQTATSIENTRLYEEEQRQRQRAEALLEVLTAAASDLSLRKVLAKVCESVLGLSVGERCSIFLMDAEHRRLEPVMSLGTRDEKLWQKFRRPPARVRREPAEQRFLQAATSWDKPIVVEDAEDSPILPRWWVKTFALKSLVQYPLRVKDRTIGAMTVHTSRDQVHFPQEEVETLAAVAKQAAIVIENARLHETLREQATTDPLTGLHNHRHIHERLDEEFARASRSGRLLAVMMLDMDNLKFFNDTCGHLVGDESIRFAAGLFSKALRASDILGRYGGDEFLAVLPETGREQAEQIGHRIVSLLAEHPLSLADSGQQVPLGVSIGVACYPEDGVGTRELLGLADAALYEAKGLGGGRVVSAHSNVIEPPAAWSLGFGFLQSLLNALAHKDPHTRKRCEDNVRYVNRLADRLHLPADAKESLRKAALLHDVGKIAVPDSTLLKPGPLDSGEWEMMRQHVQFGEAIVRGIAQISDAIEPVATHHERYDGTGYPRGLKGDAIPLLGRLLAAVDAYSAMTLDRPYRKALSHEEAKEELRKGSGSQFDPAVVEAFLAVIEAEEQARAKAA